MPPNTEREHSYPLLAVDAAWVGLEGKVLAASDMKPGGLDMLKVIVGGDDDFLLLRRQLGIGRQDRVTSNGRGH